MEKYDDGVILIRDLGAINYYFVRGGDYDDYVLATVDEENRTIRIHKLIELEPVDIKIEPHVKFTFYAPLYDLNDRASNAFLDFPEMAITGVPGDFSIDMGFGQQVPLPVDYYGCSFLLGDMQEVDGELEFAHSLVAYCGTIISQKKPLIEEEEENP